MKKNKDNTHWLVLVLATVIFLFLWIPINRLHIKLSNSNEFVNKEILEENIKKNLLDMENQYLELDEVNGYYDNNLNIEIMTHNDRELTPFEIESLCKDLLYKLGTNEVFMSKLDPSLGIVNLRIYKPLKPYYNQNDILIENCKRDLVVISFDLEKFKEINWNNINQIDLSDFSKDYELYNTFVEKVKVIEVNEPKTKNFEITYDEFLKNIDEIFTKEYKKSYLRKLNNDPVLNNGDMIIYASDLMNISEEKLEEYRKEKEALEKEIRLKQIERTVKITDAKYDGLFDDDKRVLSKTIEVYYSDKDTDRRMILKGYNFIKEDNHWRINNIKANEIRLNDDEVLPESFEKYNNIEYIDTFSVEIE